MSLTFGPNGIEFPETNGMSSLYNTQKSGWFYYKHVKTNGFTFNENWTDGQTTSTMTLPARSKVFVYTSTPLRGDTNSWGGHYEDLQYSVNGGGFTSIGRSGFVSRMMTSNRPITAHKDFCVMDFNSITSDFTLQLRTAHFHYNGSGNVNSSCGIGGGDNNTTYDANNQNISVWKQMIVMGYGQGSPS